MQTTVKRTWKPKIAGILNIVTGAMHALGLVFLVIAVISFYSVNVRQFLPPDFVPPPGVSPLLISGLSFLIISAAFPLVGGVFALQRRKWDWALAGSIIAIFAVLGTFPLGIASTILVVLSKDEFED
jgi:hypothetical protein